MTAITTGTVGTAAWALTAAQVDTVTFAADLNKVMVINPSTNSDAVWWTCDGTDPSVGGLASFYCPPGAADAQEPASSGGTVVKVISAGTPTIRVQKG